MIFSAIKCDFCKGVKKDLPAGQTVPNGWASISPHIIIKGTPKGDSRLGKWNPTDGHVPKDNEQKENLRIKKLYDKRRDQLRKKLIRTHVCEDCIEEILTGKISVKIEHDGK